MVYTWMTTLFTFAGKDGLIDKDWIGLCFVCVLCFCCYFGNFCPSLQLLRASQTLLMVLYLRL